MAAVQATPLSMSTAVAPWSRTVNCAVAPDEIAAGGWTKTTSTTVLLEACGAAAISAAISEAPKMQIRIARRCCRPFMIWSALPRVLDNRLCDSPVDS